MSKPIQIGSSSQFNKILADSKIVVADCKSVQMLAFLELTPYDLVMLDSMLTVSSLCRLVWTVQADSPDL